MITLEEIKLSDIDENNIIEMARRDKKFMDEFHYKNFRSRACSYKEILHRKGTTVHDSTIDNIFEL